jgi:hypothetical protein
MTPKEKAEQLVESFMNIKPQKLADYSVIYHPTAKQCALIAVNELIKLEQARLIVGSHNYYDYYIEVKQEIENL